MKYRYGYQCITLKLLFFAHPWKNNQTEQFRGFKHMWWWKTWKQRYCYNGNLVTFNPIVMCLQGQGDSHAVFHGVSWLYCLLNETSVRHLIRQLIEVFPLTHSTIFPAALWCPHSANAFKFRILKCKLMEQFFLLTTATSQVLSTLNIKELTGPPWQLQVWKTQKTPIYIFMSYYKRMFFIKSMWPGCLCESEDICWVVPLLSCFSSCNKCYCTYIFYTRFLYTNLYMSVVYDGCSSTFY